MGTTPAWSPKHPGDHCLHTGCEGWIHSYEGTQQMSIEYDQPEVQEKSFYHTDQIK